MFQAFDASGDSRGVRQVYNPRGYVSQLKESREGTAGKIYWTVQAMNARGQVTSALMGNGTQLTASHDAATGAVLQLMDATGTAMAQDLLLAWDAMGNLRSRRDWSGSRNQEEQFFYDARNRLTRTDSRVNGGSWVLNRQVQTYNVAGNILTKTGPGTYTYGSTRPHAVTSAGGVTYSYDANGNVTSDTSGRAFHYTGYDLVRRVSQGTAHTEFHYDAGRQRTLKRELSGSTVTSRTHYLGSVEVVWNGSSPGTGVGQYRRTIGGVVINTFYQSTGVSQQRYLHRDHLGSIVAISDEAGQIVTWMAFDPWGLRRNADAWHPWNAPPSVYLNAMLAITPRGFTGHEHVDTAGIIHMNGRIYDPHLGRFLQADPFVEDSTTLNRYTYVHNNPLAYTDPSGYFSLKKIFKLAVVIGLSVITYGAASAYFGTLMTSQLLIKTAAGAVAGFVSGGVATGTLEGAYLGALGGAIMGAAAGVNWSGSISRTLGTATAGGVQSSLTGGKFGHGFLSAGITGAASPALARVPDGGRIIANAVVGGTVSRITGGKFSNGAMTAAMAYTVSRMIGPGGRSSGPVEDANEPALAVGESRAYTEGEAGMIKEVFGTDVDLSKSRVFRKQYWVFQRRGMAMAPNGNIYFHPDDYLDDFSTASIGKRAWFMHEVTHVWQHQQGINVRRAAFNRTYDYSPLEAGKLFRSYSLEQQGEIVADYYRLSQGYRPAYGNHGIADYEAILPFGKTGG